MRAKHHSGIVKLNLLTDARTIAEKEPRRVSMP
jgi:hypothetical protein